jgi:hypothetical protein
MMNFRRDLLQRVRNCEIEYMPIELETPVIEAAVKIVEMAMEMAGDGR